MRVDWRIARFSAVAELGRDKSLIVDWPRLTVCPLISAFGACSDFRPSSIDLGLLLHELCHLTIAAVAAGVGGLELGHHGVEYFVDAIAVVARSSYPRL